MTRGPNATSLSGYSSKIIIGGVHRGENPGLTAMSILSKYGIRG